MQQYNPSGKELLAPNANTAGVEKPRPVLPVLCVLPHICYPFLVTGYYLRCVFTAWGSSVVRAHP